MLMEFSKIIFGKSGSVLLNFGLGFPKQYGSKTTIPTHFPKFYIGTTLFSSTIGFYP